jgi:hypothetical protein
MTFGWFKENIYASFEDVRSKSSSVTKLMILFLAVHALGDISTWPTERHSQARSRRPRRP